MCFSKNEQYDTRNLHAQTGRKCNGASIFVTLPGTDTVYLRSHGIPIPIKTEALPTRMITRQSQEVNVDWKAGKVWEILQDIKPAETLESGGTWIRLYFAS